MDDRLSKARLLALGVGGLYAVGAWRLDVDPGSAFHYLVATFVAVCLIWFPDQLGAVTGMGAGNGHRGVDTETPGCMVALFGWLMLAAVPLVYFGT